MMLTVSVDKIAGVKDDNDWDKLLIFETVVGNVITVIPLSRSSLRCKNARILSTSTVSSAQALKRRASFFSGVERL
jgi:hypothetical protein